MAAPVAEHKPVNLVLLYTLKAGVTPADFEAWALAFEEHGMDAHAKAVAAREPVTVGIR